MKKSNEVLSPELLCKMDAYWRAANYLSVGQIYLLDNPLLKKRLRPEHIKPRLLGHWGTTPGQNFIYVHLNRVINEHDLKMIYISGPGHGGPALVANTYLEGTYTEIYPNDFDGVPVDTSAVAGYCPAAINEAAAKHGVDLIIISTHGRTGLRRAFIGSVAEGTVRNAACPVLVVPSFARLPKSGLSETMHKLELRTPTRKSSRRSSLRKS